MISHNKKRKRLTRTVVSAGVLLSAIFVSSCGKGGSTGTTTNTYSSTNCAAGYIYNSTYGCLLQGNCNSGYAMYNGSCIALTGTGSCIAITQSIPFSGTNLQVDFMNNIRGGVFPGNGTYGSMTVGSNSFTSGIYFPSIFGSTGNFQMYIQNQASTGSGFAGGTVAVSGSLTIGGIYQQKIQSYITSSSNFPSGSATAPCVSGIAIKGHLYTTGTYGFGGDVFLYLNGTQHGVVLSFQ